jgi:methionyl-tRNA formyltransferase
VRVIFAGTPEFAATHLHSLINDDAQEVVAAYTQPDRAAGRGKKLTSSPVKLLALQYGIPIYQPSCLDDETALSDLAALKADIMVVVAYGIILPQSVLRIPSYGCINVHASVLPKWRGAAPIQRAIENGDQTSGITVIQMDAGLDTGAMLSVSHCNLDESETSASLHNKLAILGVDSLASTLRKIKDQTALSIAQDSDLSSYANKIKKSEALVDWSESAHVIERKIRAYNPFPVSFSMLDGLRIKIWSATVLYKEGSGEIGGIISATARGLEIKCGQYCLLIHEIQLPGKARMPVSEVLKSKAQLFSRGKIFSA